MKKKKIELGKKLLLRKETISGLNPEERKFVLGGKALALTTACPTPADTYQNCATGCVCPPTVPTWGLKCGCNGPVGPVESENFCQG